MGLIERLKRKSTRIYLAGCMMWVVAAFLIPLETFQTLLIVATIILIHNADMFLEIGEKEEEREDAEEAKR